MSDHDQLRPWHLLDGGELGCLALLCGYILGPLGFGYCGYWLGAHILGYDWMGWILGVVGAVGALTFAKYIAFGSAGGMLLGFLVFLFAQNSAYCWWYTGIAAAIGFVVVSVGLFIEEAADKRRKDALRDAETSGGKSELKTAEPGATANGGRDFNSS